MGEIMHNASRICKCKMHQTQIYFWQLRFPPKWFRMLWKAVDIFAGRAFLNQLGDRARSCSTPLFPKCRKTRIIGKGLRMAEPVFLNHPACEARCSRCTLECATMPGRLAYWQRELGRLLQENSAVPNRPDTLDRIDIALAAYAGLRRRVEASPRSTHWPEALSARLPALMRAVLQ